MENLNYHLGISKDVSFQPNTIYCGDSAEVLNIRQLTRFRERDELEDLSHALASSVFVTKPRESAYKWAGATTEMVD